MHGGGGVYRAHRLRFSTTKAIDCCEVVNIIDKSNQKTLLYRIHCQYMGLFYNKVEYEYMYTTKRRKDKAHILLLLQQICKLYIQYL